MWYNKGNQRGQIGQVGDRRTMCARLACVPFLGYNGACELGHELEAGSWKLERSYIYESCVF